jgi:hypothetical protein
MFITDFVRNIAWSLKNTRARREVRDDSVLPADAVAPVAAARRERRRSLAQEAAEDRLHDARPAATPAPAAGAAAQAPTGDGAPAAATGRTATPPHIDIEV